MDIEVNHVHLLLMVFSHFSTETASTCFSLTNQLKMQMNVGLPFPPLMNCLEMYLFNQQSGNPDLSWVLATILSLFIGILNNHYHIDLRAHPSLVYIKSNVVGSRYEYTSSSSLDSFFQKFVGLRKYRCFALQFEEFYDELDDNLDNG